MSFLKIRLLSDEPNLELSENTAICIFDLCWPYLSFHKQAHHSDGFWRNLNSRKQENFGVNFFSCLNRSNNNRDHPVKELLLLCELCLDSIYFLDHFGVWKRKFIVINQPLFSQTKWHAHANQTDGHFPNSCRHACTDSYTSTNMAAGSVWKNVVLTSTSGRGRIASRRKKTNLGAEKRLDQKLGKS